MFWPIRMLFLPARISRSRQRPSSRVRRRPEKDAARTFRPRTDKTAARNREDRFRFFVLDNAQFHPWKRDFVKPRKPQPDYTSSTTTLRRNRFGAGSIRPWRYPRKALLSPRRRWGGVIRDRKDSWQGTICCGVLYMSDKHRV